MNKFQEPEVADPRELAAGDQVACTNGGRNIQVLTCDPRGSVDEMWLSLSNTPGDTAHVWDEPVPGGSVALDLAGHGWKIAVLPRVWARRAIS